MNLTPTTSYNGRIVDMCFMPDLNVGSSLPQQVDMTLAEERGGFVCAGHVKLAQKVFLNLFSPRFYTDSEGHLSLASLLKNNTLYYVQTTFEVAFIDTAAQVKKFIQARETDDDPPDERLYSINLTSWSIDPAEGRLSAFITITTYDIASPEIVVPITIPIGRLNT